MYKYCVRHDSMDGGGRAMQGADAKEPIGSEKPT